LLLESGAKITHSHRLLHHCVLLRQLEIVGLLLEAGDLSVFSIVLFHLTSVVLSFTTEEVLKLALTQTVAAGSTYATGATLMPHRLHTLNVIHF
jgi:hypothetical protein